MPRDYWLSMPRREASSAQGIAGPSAAGRTAIISTPGRTAEMIGYGVTQDPVSWQGVPEQIANLLPAPGSDPSVGATLASSSPQDSETSHPRRSWARGLPGLLGVALPATSEQDRPRQCAMNPGHNS